MMSADSYYTTRGRQHSHTAALVPFLHVLITLVTHYTVLPCSPAASLNTDRRLQNTADLNRPPPPPPASAILHWPRYYTCRMLQKLFILNSKSTLQPFFVYVMKYREILYRLLWTNLCCGLEEGSWWKGTEAARIRVSASNLRQFKHKELQWLILPVAY